MESFRVYIIVFLLLLENAMQEERVTMITLCDGEIQDLECPEGEGIDIKQVFYGRSEQNRCPYEEDHPDLTCSILDAPNSLRKFCQDKKDCSVQANLDFFGTNDCAEVMKVLEIEYSCRKVYSSEAEEAEENAPKCPSVSRRSVTWPATPAGKVVFMPCPNNPDLKAAWQCGVDPVVWRNRPDLNQCASQAIINFIHKFQITSVKDKDELVKMSETVEDLTLNEHDLFGGDLGNLKEIMKMTVENMDFMVPIDDEETGEEEKALIDVNHNIAKASNNLLSDKHRESWNDLASRRHELIMEILENVEESAIKISRSIPSIDLKKEFPNLAFRIKKINGSLPAFEDLVFPSSPGADFIKIPGKSLSSLGEKGDLIIYLALYDNINKLMQDNEGQDNQPNNTIISKIISASVKSLDNSTKDNSTIRDPTAIYQAHLTLKEPVSFGLSHLEDSETKQIYCGLWKFSENKSNSWWDINSCNIGFSNSSYTNCSCDNLGDYAILRDF